MVSGFERSKLGDNKASNKGSVDYLFSSVLMVVRAPSTSTRPIQTQRSASTKRLHCLNCWQCRRSRMSYSS